MNRGFVPSSTADARLNPPLLARRRRQVPYKPGQFFDFLSLIPHAVPLCGSGSLCQRQSGSPLLLRSDGPRLKAPAAVRAHVVEHTFDAGSAEGTFVGADACLGRIRRQVAIAILAVGT